jgi:hypothetical protein
MKIVAEEHDYLFVDEVSALTRIPVDTLRYWRMLRQQRLRRGEAIGTDLGPPSLKMGGRVKYRKSDLDAWIREQEQAQPAGDVA